MSLPLGGPARPQRVIFMPHGQENHSLSVSIDVGQKSVGIMAGAAHFFNENADVLRHSQH